MKQQRGGTILGLIIGMVVGLGLALAVAVYVTKVPIPFVNKGQSRTAEQDAAETKKNKDWDPNAPLYGKNPAKPSAPPVLGASAPANPSANPSVSGPVTIPAPAVAKGDSAKTESGKSVAVGVAAPPKSDAKTDGKPAASSDPLGDLARTKSGTAPTPASTTASAEPFSYFVQVGAYRTPEDAETQRAKLSLSGIEAKVTEREQSGRAVFRVRVGPFDKKEDADKTKERLDASGVETAMVRVQR